MHAKCSGVRPCLPRALTCAPAASICSAASNLPHNGPVKHMSVHDMKFIRSPPILRQSSSAPPCAAVSTGKLVETCASRSGHTSDAMAVHSNHACVAVLIAFMCMNSIVVGYVFAVDSSWTIIFAHGSMSRQHACCKHRAHN